MTKKRGHGEAPTKANPGKNRNDVIISVLIINNL